MCNTPIDFKSDGCTFPGILKIFRKPLGAGRYHEYCIEHDFLRRHGIIPWYKANWILAKRIFLSNFIGKIRAPFYLLFTTISYPFYNETQPLPSKWLEHANYYRN